MSKKKRDARRVEQQARRELLTRRGDEALATFWSLFPSPYDSPADEESDREAGARLRAEVPAEADEPSQPLFEEEEDGSYAFRAWVFTYYAELLRQHDSSEEAARRVRFQLARIWTTDRSEMLRPDALKVAGALIRHLPLEEAVDEEADEGHEGGTVMEEG